MEKDFNKKILEKIKEAHLAPRPKWQFLLRDSFLLGFGFVLLLIGSIAFSVIIYLLKNNDWDIYEQVSDSFLEFFILTLPYFWIVLLVIFAVAINYNIKHTKKGYKYSVPVILSLSIFFSLLFGIVFYKVGVSEALDDVLGKNIPHYEKFINPRLRLWERPEEGRLAGLIVERINECDYYLVNREKEQWQINIENAKGQENCILKIGRPVKLIGSLQNDNLFKVILILDHGPGRGIFGPGMMRDLPPPPMMEMEP